MTFSGVPHLELKAIKGSCKLHVLRLVHGCGMLSGDAVVVTGCIYMIYYVNKARL